MRKGARLKYSGKREEMLTGYTIMLSLVMITAFVLLVVYFTK